MSFWEYMKKVFESNSGTSSKRIFGALGWIICLALGTYCTIAVIEAPAIVEIIIYCSTGLLGLDTLNGIFSNIFYKNKKVSGCAEKNVIKKLND